METKIKGNSQLPNKNLEKLGKRAKKKYRNRPVNAALLEYANTTGSYKTGEIVRMWNCSRYLTVTNGIATGHYCHSKHCPVCNTILAMNRLEKYQDEIATMVNPTFITLTIPNVNVEELAKANERIKNTWRRIYKILHQQGRAIKGMWRFEQTINVKTQTVHPHIHLIIDGEVNTNMIHYSQATEDHKKHMIKVWNTITGEKRKSLQSVGYNNKYKEGDRCSLWYTNDIKEMWLNHIENAELWAQKVTPVGKIALDETNKFNALEMFKYSIKGFECNIKEIAKRCSSNIETEIYKMFNEVYIPIYARSMELMHKQRGFGTFGGFGKHDEEKTDTSIEEQENEEIDLKANIKGLPIDDTTLELNENKYIDQNTGEIIAEYKITKKEYYKNELLTSHKTDKEIDNLYKQVNDKLNEKPRRINKLIKTVNELHNA